MTTENEQRPRYLCPECRIGALNPRQAFFCSWVGGQFLTVPDFPAWICDVCGRREYDQSALQELQALLDLKPAPRRVKTKSRTSPEDASGTIVNRTPERRG